MTNWYGSGGSWSGDAPVFAWDLPHGDDVTSEKGCDLPDVWITVQRCEPTENRTGRDCIWRYEPADDPDGSQALRFGADYYSEGMFCDKMTEHEKRVLCFQAAELLYLHASRLGHPIADLNLGYVYSYDRCEGRYWNADPADEVPFDCDAHAYRHYRSAAEAGVAEACYKLGDLLRDGRGCKADPYEAYSWFLRAYRLGRSHNPVVWGSAALRLGASCENGEGCTQSFEAAFDWYEKASTGLGIAVRAGESWYRGALRRAEAGLVRVRQELNGAY